MSTSARWNRIHRRRLSRRGLLTGTARAGIGALGLALVGCGGDDDAAEQAAPAAPALTTVNVTMRDFVIETDPASAPAGEVTFVATNDGPGGHTLLIIRTDLPADGLPFTEDGAQVDGGAAGLTLVGEIEEFASGLTARATFALSAGRYVLICNIEGHYQLGMFREFSVV